MKLHVLARGDVSERTRVGLPDVGQCIEAARVETAEGDLHADHLRALLALPVHPTEQAERTKLLGRELSALVLLEDADELVDIRGVGKLGQVRSSHDVLVF